jgi:hypothetical protein
MVMTNAERQWLARVQLIINQVNGTGASNATGNYSLSKAGLEERQDRDKSDEAFAGTAA